MRIGSMFSGYGGLDLAVEAAFPGAEPAWFCEWEDAPSRILAHHWPGVPNHRDVTTIDWARVEPVDIITGGYPCQPFSAAGRREGTNDERHLWPYVREAVRVLRPRYVILENVAGHRSLGLDRVLGDMAEDGMHVRWTSVRASDVGAPHHRERLFILAEFPDSEGARWGVWDASLPDSGSEERACRSGLRTNEPEGIRGARSGHRHNHSVDWGKYAPAVRRWERLTRPAPAPTELGTRGTPRLNAAFAEWMMGLPAGWVTGPVDVDDAGQGAFFPAPPRPLRRVDQLKAIGNGVCPQQAEAAIAQLLSI